MLREYERRHGVAHQLYFRLRFDIIFRDDFRLVYTGNETVFHILPDPSTDPTPPQQQPSAQLQTTYSRQCLVDFDNDHIAACTATPARLYFHGLLDKYGLFDVYPPYNLHRIPAIAAWPSRRSYFTPCMMRLPKDLEKACYYPAFAGMGCVEWCCGEVRQRWIGELGKVPGRERGKVDEVGSCGNRTERLWRRWGAEDPESDFQPADPYGFK